MTEQLPLIAKFIHKIMRYIPYITIAACLLVYAVFIIQERYSSIFNLSLYLIPLIVISTILIINKNKKYSCNDYVSIFNISFNKLKILYFITLILTIICLGFGNQGWLYIVLVFIMYTIILAQLFSKGLNTKWFILELIISTSIVVLPQLLAHAYYYADTDLLFHASYSSTIIDIASVSTGFGGVYESFCGYHLLISSFSLLTALATNVSLYFVSTITVIFSIPIVYAIGVYFTNSKQISAFSIFFYALLPIVLESLFIPAPRVMSSMAFLILLYLLIKFIPKYKVQSVILIIITMSYMILVHHAQLLFIITISICLIIGVLIYSKKINLKRIIGVIILLTIPIITLCVKYWNQLFYIINSRLFGQIETNAISDIVIETRISDLSVLNQLLDINYQYTLAILSSPIMIVLIFAGIYILFLTINTRKKICYILPLVLITFILFIPGIIDLFPTISQAFQLYRLRILLSFFFAIIMGVGCIAILNLPKTKSIKILSTFIIIGLCTTLIISSISINSMGDNYDLFTEKEPYFENGDIALFNLINEIIPYKKSSSVLYSDLGHAYYYDKGCVNNPFVRQSCDTYQLFTKINAPTKDMNYILFPYIKYYRNGLKIGNGMTKYIEPDLKIISPTEEASKIFENNVFHHNIIYQNNQDKLYYNRG